ncbi:MAG: hypothetical protein PHQ22_10300 [Sulfuricurvum sp.]|jgi:phenylalanyl-tRNA synthetase alpha subunit|nr:hypothetical protein [Sulfuricurvum sp.]
MENEIAVLEKTAVEVDTQAQGLAVKNQEQYNCADSFLKTVKDLQKKVKDTFSPIIQKAFAAHKEAKAQELKHLEPLLKAEAIIKEKMLSFLQEQERIRVTQERKLQAEAEKKRQEALQKADQARQSGNEAKADKYDEKAQNIIAPVLAPTVDKGNIVVKKLWRAEVTDLFALVQAIANGTVPITAVEANMTTLNNMARTFKDTMSYPGVKFVSEESLAASGRK